MPHSIEKAHLLKHNSSSEYRERIRAKQMAAALTTANLQPNYIALEPQEIELGTTYVAPIISRDTQLLHAQTPEQVSPAIEQQFSE